MVKMYPIKLSLCLFTPDKTMQSQRSLSRMGWSFSRMYLIPCVVQPSPKSCKQGIYYFYWRSVPFQPYFTWTVSLIWFPLIASSWNLAENEAFIALIILTSPRPTHVPGSNPNLGPRIWTWAVIILQRATHRPIQQITCSASEQVWFRWKESM